MAKYIEPYILIILGAVILRYSFSDFTSILILLGGIIVVSLLLIVHHEQAQLIITMISAVAVCIFPPALPFFPAIIYCSFYSKKHIAACSITLLTLVIAGRGFTLSLLLPLILCGLSSYMAYVASKKEMLSNKVKELRDNSAEREIELGRKNKQLMEMQQDQIHLATLTERNRIAREIHDNVGHLLSRAILQTGSINAITTDQTIKPFLSQLKDTLDDAMNNIRNSVHDLHDESIDLNSSIKTLCQEFEFCPVELQCDISAHIPKDVKYCFITVAKEALNNIAKHSNASKASIYIHEHPGFFQLLIQDNGHAATLPQSDHSGIGLTNMRDRVTALGGVINISNDSGFKIFISIPKRKED